LKIDHGEGGKDVYWPSDRKSAARIRSSIKTNWYWIAADGSQTSGQDFIRARSIGSARSTSNDHEQLREAVREDLIRVVTDRINGREHPHAFACQNQLTRGGAARADDGGPISGGRQSCIPPPVFQFIAATHCVLHNEDKDGLVTGDRCLGDAGRDVRRTAAEE
jgi:hypothetical protein